VLRFFVEAKRPHTGIGGKSAPFQIKSYAWNRSLPFSVLTDFEHLQVYQSTRRPDRDKSRQGLLSGYNLKCSEYAASWDQLWEMLSREAVLAGDAATLVRSLAGRGGVPVDESFLRDMERWRQDLANDLLDRNDDLELWQLEEATQRILDRLVFVRVVEDRDVEPNIVLRKFARLTDSYRFLCREFRRLDAFYNGQLFAKHFSETLEVGDYVIQTIIAELYPVDGSPYRFDTFQADFLGKVYERFLGKVFEEDSPGHVRLVNKPEVRHAGGVYYTPRWVVDHMVVASVGPLVAGKMTPKQVAQLRIVDPASGSGTFLLGVLDFLIRWHEDYYTANPKADANNHYVNSYGQRRLTSDAKGEILVNNIFGVDVDPRAVEVAQMSLYLRILEEETTATMSQQPRLFEGARLPSLVKNIRAGNSLIAEADVPAVLLSVLALSRRINPFDWKGARGFKTVFDNDGGFDVVIGNPPYTRVQELRTSRPEETAIMEDLYASARAGFDIASLFTEHALTLIKPRVPRKRGGTVTFITSRTFTETDAGGGIRSVLAAGRHVASIIDFGAGRVFPEAGAYTVILTATARDNATCELTRVTDPPSADALEACLTDPIRHAAMPASALPGDKPWPLSLPAEDALLTRLAKVNKTLADVTGGAIFQAPVTGSDAVFRAVDLGPDPTSTARRSVRPAAADPDSPPLALECVVLYPLYTGGSLEPFHTQPAREWLIVPYGPKQGATTWDLLTWPNLQKAAPNVATWLSANKATLTARTSGTWSATNWWSYSRRQNLERFAGSKIMVPSMINRLCATYDTNGHFFVNVSTGGYGITLPDQAPVTPEYVTALLNSTLMSWVLKRYSRAWRGGWFEARKGNLERLPIATPDAARQAHVVEAFSDAQTAVATALANPDEPQLVAVAAEERRSFDHEVNSLYKLSAIERVLIQQA